MTALLLTTAAAWWMAAVAWFVQAVSYPAFAAVPPRDWPAHHAHHGRGITPVVVPAMAIELVGASFVAAAPPDGASGALALAGLLLALGAIGLTAAVAAPAHSRLAKGYEATLARRLLRAHAVRAVLWPAHGVTCLLLLASVG